MTLKIILDTMSQPSRALLIFCRAAGIQHEFQQLLIKNGEHKTPEYTKLNPLQLVPVIEHNGVPIRESVAIFRYLANTQTIDDHWYPKDPLKQAKVDEYLEWQHLNTRVFCAQYFRNKWLIPVLTQKPPKESTVERFRKGMEASLDTIEKVFLAEGKNAYIAGGDAISVADILACCELEQPSMAGYDVRAGRAILADYMERVRNELNPHYDDAHKMVYKMRDRFGGKVPGLDFIPESKL